LLLSINIEYNKTKDEVEKLKEQFNLHKTVISNPINAYEKNYKTQEGDLLIVLCQYERVLKDAKKQLRYK